jgi:ribonuclease HI
VKKVYVDASDKTHLITIVIEGEKGSLWDSTLNYESGLTSTAAEFRGIIVALQKVSGDLEIVCDDESIVMMLSGKSKVRTKNLPYVEKINKLREGRHVEFKHENRDVNKASLKQRGLSLEEINNPDMKKWWLDYWERLREEDRKRKDENRKRNRARYT